MSDHKWLVNLDGDLCLSGYPIRIRRANGLVPYFLEQDGRSRHAYMKLENAKRGAIECAAELDEFRPSAAAQTRADGFYWVRDKLKGKWSVAEWREESYWLVSGLTHTFSDSDVGAEIDERRIERMP